MIVGDCVPEEDQMFFIILLRIYGIVFSPVIPKGYCSVLRLLIDEYHSLFSELYSSALYFDDHFHSYVVTETPSMSMICIEGILSPWVLHGHKLFTGTRLSEVVRLVRLWPHQFLGLILIFPY